MSAQRAIQVAKHGLAGVAASLAALGATAGLPGGAQAAAAAPAAACQPFSGRPCLVPFPDNRLTRRDGSSATGVRLHLPAGAMPRNTKGVAVAPGPYDRNDGFSPGSEIVLHVAGLDNAAAFRRTDPVQLGDLSRAFARRAPIVVFDQATGARRLIWAELDANATGAAHTDLLIHPGQNLAEGHTYIVALRRLRSAGGAVLAAPRWFARLRDGLPLPGPERPQRARYVRIFAALARAGISRSDLYEAWNFTVASRQNLTGRMLAIRNHAFAQLGDRNLADGRVTGAAPAFAITRTVPPAPGGTDPVTEVFGTFRVPCYLIVCGASAQPGFHYGSHGLDAPPTQIPGNVATTNFECVIPATATAARPARIAVYGHGLLGQASEVEAGNVRAMANEHDMVFCATAFWGLADGDTGNDAGALANLNRFPAVIDRLQQGALNTLFLGRLLLHSAGLATSPAFQAGGVPVIDTSHLYYDGNSQGGIEGGMLTALAPDWTHAVLGVSGMNYGNLLVQRSVDFAPFGAFLFSSYTDPAVQPLLLDLMQQLWDRGDPDGYAEQLTTHPLPGTPAHRVLMQMAYGDHQVSMYAAAVEARTIGAAAYRPALDLATNRRRDRELFYGLPAISGFPFHGSAIEVWDSGPGRVQPPPLGNIPPAENPTTNLDPHEDVRSSPAARTQKSAFLQPEGTIIDVCGGRPCRTSVFTP